MRIFGALVDSPLGHPFARYFLGLAMNNPVYNFPVKCGYCGEELQQKINDYHWRMSADDHERMGGYYLNPEGRGIHRLCKDCDQSEKILFDFFQRTS